MMALLLALLLSFGAVAEEAAVEMSEEVAVVGAPVAQVTAEEAPVAQADAVEAAVAEWGLVFADRVGFDVTVNEKAEEIGCVNTIYENPHGLDDGEYAGQLHSTAEDQAKVVGREFFVGIV